MIRREQIKNGILIMRVPSNMKETFMDVKGDMGSIWEVIECGVNYFVIQRLGDASTQTEYFDPMMQNRYFELFETFQVDDIVYDVDCALFAKVLDNNFTSRKVAIINEKLDVYFASFQILRKVFDKGVVQKYQQAFYLEGGVASAEKVEEPKGEEIKEEVKEEKSQDVELPTVETVVEEISPVEVAVMEEASVVLEEVSVAIEVEIAPIKEESEVVTLTEVSIVQEPKIELVHTDETTHDEVEKEENMEEKFNHDVKKTLKRILRREGLEILDDRKKIETNLKEQYTERKREINLILLSSREHIPQNIKQEIALKGIDGINTQPFVEMLIDGYCLAEEAALWVVQIWTDVIASIFSTERELRTMAFDEGIYTGEVDDEEFNGFGRYSYANGDQYVGEWLLGEPHGYGVFKYADGSVYCGGFYYGTRHGNGLFTNKDKSQSGLWEKGEFVS